MSPYTTSDAVYWQSHERRTRVRENVVDVVPFDEKFYRRAGFRYGVRCAVDGCLTEDRLSLTNAAKLAIDHAERHEDALKDGEVLQHVVHIIER